MKKFLPLIVVLSITIGIFSCQKNGVSVVNPLNGKWNVKVDSIHYGIGPNQQVKTYTGIAGDYFEFRDNKLYVKEGNQLTTYNYKVISQNKLHVTTSNPNDIPLNLFIDNINGTSANINFFPTLLNPGGNDERWVSLSK